MSNLAFKAADTLGTTLYQQQDNLMSATELRHMLVGPWHLEIETQVVSDVMSIKELSFWVNLIPNLRMYLVQRENQSVLAILNQSVLDEITLSKQPSLKKRWAELQPAITAVFVWQESNHRWEQTLYSSVFWLDK